MANKNQIKFIQRQFAKAYLNSTTPDERDFVGFDGEGHANDEDADALMEAGWKMDSRTRVAPCPLCNNPMEIGDELPEERCCMVCAKK